MPTIMQNNINKHAWIQVTVQQCASVFASSHDDTADDCQHRSFIAKDSWAGLHCWCEKQYVGP